jgi:SEC-C motif-containing protein
MGRAEDQEGWVKFIARYKIAGKAHRLEEHSYFKREMGNWKYVAAEDVNDSQARSI